MNRYLLYTISVLIILLLAASGTASHFFEKYRVVKQDKHVLVESLHQQIERQRNQAGQELARVQAMVLSPETVREILASELTPLREAFGVKIRPSQVIHKTDVSISTEVKDLLLSAKDTVVLIQKDTLTVPAKVFHYNDGYNQFTDIYYNNQLQKSGKIRNDATFIAHRGKRERWFLGLPKIWKARPIHSEVFLFNPMSGTDTLRTIISTRKIN